MTEMDEEPRFDDEELNVVFRTLGQEMADGVGTYLHGTRMEADDWQAVARATHPEIVKGVDAVLAALPRFAEQDELERAEIQDLAAYLTMEAFIARMHTLRFQDQGRQ